MFQVETNIALRRYMQTIFSKSLFTDSNALGFFVPRFLTESFGELQSELANNAQMYEDCIKTYEREAAGKDARIFTLEE